MSDLDIALDYAGTLTNQDNVSIIVNEVIQNSVIISTPQGVPGSAGYIIKVTAGMDLEKNRALVLRAGLAYHADNFTVEDIDKVIGITKNIILAGKTGDIQVAGILPNCTDISADLPVFLHNDGYFNSIAPTHGFITQLGIGLSDNKILINIQSSTVSYSLGPIHKNKTPSLNDLGLLDVSFIDKTVGNFDMFQVSEDLSAGELVNIYHVDGLSWARKAQADSTGREAHGYVLANYKYPNEAVVFFSGVNTSVKNAVLGRNFLSADIPGAITSYPPSNTGNVIQSIGFVTNHNTLNFKLGQIIIKA